MMLFQLCGADCTQPKSPPLLNGRPFVLVFIAFLVNNVEKWEKVWRIGRKCLLLHDYLDVRIDEMND